LLQRQHFWGNLTADLDPLSGRGLLKTRGKGREGNAQSNQRVPLVMVQDTRHERSEKNEKRHIKKMN